jgi:hypothetical protein
MPRRKDRLRVQLMLGLIRVDLVAILIGFVTANLVRFDTPFASCGFYLMNIVMPILLAIAINNDAYSVGALIRRRYSIGRALRAFMIAIATVTFLGLYLRAGTIPVWRAASASRCR